MILRPIRLADLPYNSTGSKVVIGDANDDYVQKEVKLNGVGELLDTDDDPVYIEYLVKRPLTWTELNFAKDIAT